VKIFDFYETVQKKIDVITKINQNLQFIPLWTNTVDVGQSGSALACALWHSDRHTHIRFLPIALDPDFLVAFSLGLAPDGVVRIGNSNHV
jgi:hypothetical protein